jgi:hypothetical protein
MEFETEIDGVFISGVGILKWNDQGLIAVFKVMVRPLPVVNKLHLKVGEIQQRLKPKDS